MPKIKDFVIALLSIGLSLLSTNLSAYSIALEASNLTDKMVKPLASLSYEAQGEMHWQVPLPTMNTLIAPKGQSIPMDKIRHNLTGYSLEYFDFQDTEGHLLAVCLSNYFAIQQDALIRFILLPLPGQPNRYHCERQVFKGPMGKRILVK